MDPLTELSNKYGCDKSDKNHRYTPLYHKIFEPYRNKEFTMLEYGYGVGNSTKMWLEYFSKCRLVTIDIRPTPTDELVVRYMKEGRLIYVQAEQIDKDDILPVLEKYGKFPFIIDDASHMAEDQQYTFSFSMPYVIDGGWYIIEDLKCKRSNNDWFDVEADKTLLVLEKYHENKKFSSKVLSKKQNRYLSSSISSVSIYDKISFIGKKGELCL